MQNFDKLRPLALLLLRWGLGIVFIYHGYPKLFGNAELSYQLFATKLGLPGYLSYIAGVVELFGGCLLIAGLFTRIAGLLLAGQMAVAIWKVHMGKGVLAVSEYEFPLVLALGSFLLLATGAGVISLDRLVFKEKA